MIHYVGEQRTLNCWLVVLYLFAMRRVRRLKLDWSNGGFPHLLGVTKWGNVLHFKRTNGTPRWWGLWFQGRVQVFSQRIMVRRWWLNEREKTVEVPR